MLPKETRPAQQENGPDATRDASMNAHGSSAPIVGETDDRRHGWDSDRDRCHPPSKPTATSLIVTLAIGSGAVGIALMLTCSIAAIIVTGSPVDLSREPDEVIEHFDGLPSEPYNGYATQCSYGTLCDTYYRVSYGGAVQRSSWRLPVDMFERDGIAFAMAAGWPSRNIVCVTYYNHPEYDDNLAQKIFVSNSGQGNPKYTVKVSGIKPRWGASIFNFLIWSSIVLATCLANRLCIERFRRRRGLCAGCGYNKTGMLRCPECGLR